MPIDYKKYPPNWKTEIRTAILERDGNKCKFCGIENKAVGFRVDGEFVYSEAYLRAKKSGYGFYQTSRPYFKIILTIMHLDHDITNNNYSNLAAACQKCHLNYDKEHHKKNARNTREKKKGLQNLF
jgi:5-methylcytosine-specific restriction endonuclease McrA